MNAISADNMRTPFRAINTFFLLFAVLALGGFAPGYAADGTSTNTASGSRAKKKKSSERLAVIRIHMEVTDDGSGPKAEVMRSSPLIFPIKKEPFFDERDVASAEILETPDGGYVIQLIATDRGQHEMEMATVSSNGRHLLIYGQWTPDGDLTEGRWLAAPLLRSPLRNGQLVFTADASRQEAIMLVDGLNNVAVKLKNQPKGKSSSQAAPPSSNQKLPTGKNSTAQDLINSQQGK
jgi:hypothetical protein